MNFTPNPHRSFVLICLAGISWSSGPARSQSNESPGVRVVPLVSPVPAELRRSLDLAPFYQKHINIGGFPILGSTNVSNDAMREAAYVVSHMLALRPEALKVMGTNGARLVVMAYNEYTTDVPEQANRTPKVFHDRRARGLGGRISSCAEENLLGFPNDTYEAESILVHEFGHAIAGVGMRAIDPTFNTRLREAFQQATNAGLWKGTYAGSNPGEYWAEGAQNWFNDNARTMRCTIMSTPAPN